MGQESLAFVPFRKLIVIGQRRCDYQHTDEMQIGCDNCNTGQETTAGKNRRKADQ